MSYSGFGIDTDIDTATGFCKAAVPRGTDPKGTDIPGIDTGRKSDMGTGSGTGFDRDIGMLQLL